MKCEIEFGVTTSNSNLVKSKFVREFGVTILQLRTQTW